MNVNTESTGSSLVFHKAENRYDFKWVEGEFSVSEADKMLSSLIKDKINYHSFEIFCIQEKNDGDTSHSRQCILELRKVENTLKTMLEALEAPGARLKIAGTIEIEIKH